MLAPFPLGVVDKCPDAGCTRLSRSQKEHSALCKATLELLTPPKRRHRANSATTQQISSVANETRAAAMPQPSEMGKGWSFTREAWLSVCADRAPRTKRKAAASARRGAGGSQPAMQRRGDRGKSAAPSARSAKYLQMLADRGFRDQ